MQRMGIKLEYSVLDPEKFVPSANQGTIVAVAKKGTVADKLVRVLRRLAHEGRDHDRAKNP